MISLIRYGKYAFYHDNEYRLGRTLGDSVELCSSNIEDLNNGFVEYCPEEIIGVSGRIIKIDKSNWSFVCTKKVHSNELGQVFKISTRAVYKGLDCFVCGGDKQGNICLTIGLCRYGQPMGTKEEKELYYSLGFEPKNDGFEKMVTPEECDRVYEVREDIELSKS